MVTRYISDIEKKKEIIRKCIADYNLPDNPAIDDELLEFEGTPFKAPKRLPCLILTYKREATTGELKKVSDQPAAVMRDLRKAGFLFKSDGKNFEYKNTAGEMCRKITGFNLPKAAVKGRIKAIIDKSTHAILSAIEIYNKPNFKYREEIFSILIVNAWELLLKAKIISDSKKGLKSIQVFENGKVKLNRSKNPFTIDIHKAIQILFDAKKIDRRCCENIKLLVEIRDNAIHLVNKDIGLSKKVQEYGMASLKNYIRIIGEWFEKDLSEYDFYLMPMSFFHPTELESYSLSSPDEQINRMLKYFSEVESKYPEIEDSHYSLALKIKTEFVKANKEDAIAEVRFTTDPTAPAITITEEDKIRGRINYKQLVDKLKNRYLNFKVNGDFYKILKAFENPEKYQEKFCLVRYHNPLTKKGPMKFYSNGIIKEFDRFYTRKSL